MQYYDPNNTGFIKFSDFRKVMQNLKLNLEEKYTELLIYLMKKNETLEDLAYRNITNLLDDSKSDDSDRSKCMFVL
jgi:Ca2+-binding EF-hand superfamily protein